MTVEPANKVHQRSNTASVNKADGYLDEKIIRSLFMVGGYPSSEEAINNWHILTDYLSRMPGCVEDRNILDYLHKWYSMNDGAPDCSVAKEYFERQDDIDTVERLDDSSKRQFHIRSNFLFIVQQAVNQHEIRHIMHLCRDAAYIAEHGRTIDKRTLRGAKDAINYLLDQTQAMDSIAGPPRRSLMGLRERVAEETARPRLSTGFIDLDDALGGGIAAGKIHMVTAPPGNYKSTYLCYLAKRFASMGARVAYMSCDEGPTATEARLLAMGVEETAPISMTQDPEATLELEAEYLARSAQAAARIAAVESIRGKPIRVVAKDGRIHHDEADEIIIALEIKKLGLNIPPVLIVDSIQMVPIAGGLKFRDEYSKINATMERMRRLAEKHRIIIIVASEANRASFARRDQKENNDSLTAGKGSSAIEYRADVAAVMRKMNDAGLVRLKVVKNRLGQREPEIYLTYDGKTLRETAVAPKDDNTELHKFLDIVRKNPRITTTRHLYAACKLAGIQRHSTVDEQLALARLRGLINGGNGKPFQVIDPPSAGDLL
jgi:replicative DNA helicase